MSTKDDKAVETTAIEQAGDHKASGPGKADADGATASIILFFILGLAASLVVGWVVFPQLLYSSKDQPVNFNHALHVGLVDDSCQSCHYFREDGTFSGTPEMDNCLECHYELIGESEEEAHFYENYVVPGREVRWFVYSEQPDCVFFSHVAHVKMGKLDCVTCHGHIGESTHSRPYQENRISGYSRDIWGHNIAGIARNSWDRMKMNDCADCHTRMTGRRTSVQTAFDACFVCHK